MATLKEFRTENPQYNDLSDDTLMIKLHSNFYPDMPFDQFKETVITVGESVRSAVAQRPTLAIETRAKARAIGEIKAEGSGLTTEQESELDPFSGVTPLVGARLEEVDTGIKPQDVTATVAGLATVAAGHPELAPLAAGLAGGGTSLILGETPKEAAKEFAFQALMEVPGTIGSLGKKFLKPLAGAVDATGAAALKVFGEEGGRIPSLDLVTREPLIDKLADISEGALFGRKMAKYKNITLPKERVAAVERAVDKLFASKVSLEESGSIVARAVKIGDTIGDEIGSQFFKDVWRPANELGLVVDLESAEQVAGIRRFVTATGEQGIDKPTLYRTAASKMGDTSMARVINDLAGLYEEFGDNIPLEEAEKLLQRVGREIGSTRERVAKRSLVMVKSELKERIEGQLADNGLLPGYRKAKKFWGEFSEQFRNEFVNKSILDMSRKNPERVVAKVFQPGNISDLRRTKKALSGAPEVFDSLKRVHLERRVSSGAMGKMANVAEGVEPIEQLLGLNKEQIAVAFTDPQKKSLNDLALALRASTRRGDATGGKMLVQLVQGGAAASLIGFGQATDSKGLTAAGILILGGPLLIGRALLNPSFVRAMTVGLRVPVTSHLRTSIMSRIVGEFLRSQNEQMKIVGASDVNKSLPNEPRGLPPEGILQL